MTKLAQNGDLFGKLSSQIGIEKINNKHLPITMPRPGRLRAAAQRLMMICEIERVWRPL